MWYILSSLNSKFQEEQNDIQYYLLPIQFQSFLILLPFSFFISIALQKVAVYPNPSKTQKVENHRGLRTGPSCSVARASFSCRHSLFERFACTSLQYYFNMAGSWQPEEGRLRQILQLLKEVQSPDNSKQREVFQVSKLIFINHWFVLFGSASALFSIPVST